MTPPRLVTTISGDDPTAERPQQPFPGSALAFGVGVIQESAKLAVALVVFRIGGHRRTADGIIVGVAASMASLHSRRWATPWGAGPDRTATSPPLKTCCWLAGRGRRAGTRHRRQHLRRALVGPRHAAARPPGVSRPRAHS
jgi:hypothetical protein